MCQHGARQVSLLRDGALTPLVTHYKTTKFTKKFNSPNDVVVALDGGIFFTDPPYGVQPGAMERWRRGGVIFGFLCCSAKRAHFTPGLNDKEEDPRRELPFNGVYYLNLTQLEVRRTGPWCSVCVCPRVAQTAPLALVGRACQRRARLAAACERPERRQAAQRRGAVAQQQRVVSVQQREAAAAALGGTQEGAGALRPTRKSSAERRCAAVCADCNSLRPSSTLLQRCELPPALTGRLDLACTPFAYPENLKSASDLGSADGLKVGMCRLRRVAQERAKATVGR